MNDTRDSLGIWLGRQLRSKQMSQADLANRIGVTRAAVSAWITDRSTPRPEMLEAIERELGLQAGSSIARGDDPDDLHVRWYHRPAPVDGGRDMGNPATFAFAPDLAVLAREATQNSLDEQWDESRPVRVCFTLHRITGERLRSFL